MIASLITVSGIPKPLLCHKKMIFVFGDVAPACALLEIILRGSTPIQLLNAVTWYPPACWCRTEKQTTFTLVFDKQLAICRDHRNARYLRDTAHSCPDVIDISHITALFLETIYQSSIFTVVTKYSHTDSIPVYHVTVDAEGIVSSFAVGIDDVRTTWGLSATRFYFAAGFT